MRHMPAALAGAVILSATAAAAADTCVETRVDLRGPRGLVQFTVEIADDAAERAQGLMNRESMSFNRGMLFVYDTEEHVSFWMRNTLIPLDMIFLDATGTVVSVHAGAKPLDETPIPSQEPAQYVLEINGGYAERLGIAAGSELRNPAIDQAEAAWPCDAAASG